MEWRTAVAPPRYEGPPGKAAEAKRKAAEAELEAEALAELEELEA